MNMHLSIIAQFQDRASRAMKSLLRLQQQHERMQKAYGNATSQAARKQAELARASQRTARAMGNEASAAARLRQALYRVNEMIHKQVSLRERLRRAGSLAREGLGRMGHAAALGAGIYGSVQAGAASLASLVVGPAAQVEGYMVQLQALEGSAEKARKAMSWITRFATKTPLELHQVIDAYAQLRTFGLDPTNGTMQALVDTMAMSGKGYEHLQGLILAVGQAWVKGKLQGEEIMQMTERMVPVWDLLSKALGKPVPVIQKLASKGRLGRNVIAQLIELMGKRAAGASEKFSRTWNGMVTNMADMWFKFRLMVAHSGVFEWLKGKLAYLLDVFNKLEASGRLQQIAQQIGQSIITGLKNLWQFGVGVWAVLKRVGAALAWAADKLGGWNNLAMALMAIPIINVLASVVSGFMLLGQAVMTVAPVFALLATPVGLVVGGLAALAAAVAGVIWYFDLWPSITAAVSTAWNSLISAGQALVAWFKVLPGHVSAAWQALKQWLAQPFDPFPGLRQQVQHIINVLTGLPQRALAALQALAATIASLDIGALIRGVDWMGLLQRGLNAALNAVRAAFSGLNLGGLLRPLQWSGIVLARLGGALNQLIARFTGLDIGALIRGVDWTGLLQRGLNAALNAVRAAFAGLNLGSLLRPLQWSGIVLARLGGALNQLIAHFSGLDIGSFIRGVDWTGLLQRGLNASLTAVRNAFAGLNLFEAGVKALQSFWDGLKSVIGDIAKWAKEKLSNIFKLPKIKLPSFSGWWGGNNAQKAQQATAQARAAGGPFRAGPLLVGERGPELIYAARSGWVAHNDNLKRLIDLSRRAAASIAAVSLVTTSLATHMALTPPRIEPASPPARLIAAGGSGQQVARAGGQQVTVHYAPQVTVQGAAGAQDVQAALDAHLDRLLDALERRQRERERLEF